MTKLTLGQGSEGEESWEHMGLELWALQTSKLKEFNDEKKRKNQVVISGTQTHISRYNAQNNCSFHAPQLLMISDTNNFLSASSCS